MGNSSRNNSSAFTVVELVVSIVITAILATIVLVSYNGVTKRALETSIQNNLSTLGKRIEVDGLKAGAYPTSASDVNAGKGIPASDSMTYQYASSSDFYCLSAVSKDGSSIYRISSVDKVVKAGSCSSLFDWKQISSGYTFTCGLTYDGVVYCWGYNGAQQVGSGNVADYVFTPEKVLQGEMPVGAVKSISAGYGTACAIASDDNAYCWGWNGEGEVGNNSTTQIFATPTKVANGARPDGIAKSISVGNGNVCAIGSDDAAYCWGANGEGELGISNATAQSLVPVKVTKGAMPSLSVKYIASGDSTNCVVASDDKAYCWGWNGYGELGDGTETDSYLPVAVSRGEMTAAMTIKSVSVGATSSCAIDTNDALFCWGRGWEGQLGNDDWSTSNTPVAVSIDMVSSVTVGEQAVCALTTIGTVKCWGNNNEGVIGSDTLKMHYSVGLPVDLSNGAIPSGSKITSLSMYYDHTCAIASNGKGYCWGSGWEGQLGNGRLQDYYEIHSPVAISRGEMPTGTVKATFGRDAGTCAWASDSRVYCWGYVDYEPYLVDWGLPGTGVVKQLSLSDEGMCVIASDDAAYCYGYNNHGQLGDGTKDDYYSFKKVLQGAMPAGAIKSISAANSQSCVIASDNRPYCWGYNGYVDNLTPTLLPQGAMPSLSVKALSAGHDFVCAIATLDNRVYCMGLGTDAQLGNGTYSSSPTFVAVSQGAMPSTAVKSIVTNMDSYHACAIGSDDNAYCWGGGWDGQLGNGDPNSSSVPVKALMPAGAVKMLDTFDYNTCGISFDDMPYCWGGNDRGSLGNGDDNRRTSPTSVLHGEIPSPFTVKKIDAGLSTACVVAWNDNAYCWGTNYYGQLGVSQNSSFLNRIPNLVGSPN